jgi:hypothetical protein
VFGDKLAEVKYWYDQITLADSKRLKVEEISKTATDYLKGKQVTEAEAYGKEVSIVNMFLPYYKINLSTLYSRDPKIVVSPAGGRGTEQAAWVLQLVAQYFYKELKVKRTNKKIVGNALLKPYGVCKVGFISSTGQETIESEEEADAGFMQHTFPTFYGMVHKEPKDVGIIKKTETMQDESPYIVRVKAENILIDPNATCIEEAAWVGEKYKESYADFIKNPRYSASARKKVRPTRYLTGSSNLDQRNQFIDLVELHIKERVDGVDVIRIKVTEASLKDEFLFDEQSDLPIDGYQYVFLNFNDFDDGDWANNCNFAMLKNIQDAKNRTRTNIQTMANKFVSKVVYDRDKVIGPGEDALLNGGYGAAVKVEGDPRLAVATVTNNQIPAELYQLDEKNDEAWVGTSGLTQAKQLGVSEANTLGEAQIGEGAASDRESEMSDVVDEFALEQATKFIQVIKKFLPFETFAKIVNQMEMKGGLDFVQDWRSVTEEELRADYDYDIDTGASRPINVLKTRQEDRELLAQLMEMAPALQGSGKVFDAWPLIRKMLRDANLRNIDEFIKNAVPPPMPPEGTLGAAAGQGQGREAILQEIMQRNMNGGQI